jgi:hypothetical protein
MPRLYSTHTFREMRDWTQEEQNDWREEMIGGYRQSLNSFSSNAQIATVQNLALFDLGEQLKDKFYWRLRLGAVAEKVWISVSTPAFLFLGLVAPALENSPPPLRDPAIPQEEDFPPLPGLGPRRRHRMAWRPSYRYQHVGPWTDRKFAFSVTYPVSLATLKELFGEHVFADRKWEEHGQYNDDPTKAPLRGGVLRIADPLRIKYCLRTRQLKVRFTYFQLRWTRSQEDPTRAVLSD